MAAKNEKWQIDRGYKKSRCKMKDVLSYISDNHHSHSHSDMEHWEQGWRPVSDLHSLLEENIDNNGRSSLPNDVVMAWLMINDDSGCSNGIDDRDDIGDGIPGGQVEEIGDDRQRQVCQFLWSLFWKKFRWGPFWNPHRSLFAVKTSLTPMVLSTMANLNQTSWKIEY